MATNQWWKLALWASLCALTSGLVAAQQTPTSPSANRIAQRNIQRSRDFLARRNVNGQTPAALLAHARMQDEQVQANSASSLTAAWSPIGPTAIQTSTFGLISGRVTSIAVDPSDATGNTVYAGTTGGGVWKSTNAAGNAGSASFTPLTDTLPISSGCSTPPVPSLSIGAITVQPGGTGVILAGTGDPNDALDSYYGMGLLRSADGGNTWCMISGAVDDLLRQYTFLGEGFSGFAWSGTTPQFVVAAVANSAEGMAVGAGTGNSFAGLYYSADAGQTWHLATITDGTAATVQASNLSAAGNPGNSATSVAWNPVRQRFYAAVRYHGYYESLDGMTWTRLANQPGVNLFTAQCPPNPGTIGSTACPIFRGTVVAQPVTGDLFAITVDNSNMDQGLWRDVCNAGSSGCASSTVTFSQQIADTAIESNGAIPQGDYDLSLAAVPAQQDTLLFVGTQDLYRCSLLNGCVWRNTTNTNGCAAAKVAPSEHAIDATFGASGLMYFGNDGGLWRTTDAVNQQQSTCSADDAAHFQNLNGGLGSIGEVGSFSVHPQDASVLMAAMGAFGTAAPSGSGSAWQQILDGEGDYNAIDPESPQNWYATSAAPISINLCTAGASCNKADFGSPVIGSAQVGNDGFGLTGTAPWILDPQNTTNIIIGTCRIWRGPANGQGWLSTDAISIPLDKDQTNGDCVGNAQIRSLAASGGASTTEVMYAGMTGSYDGGGTVAGHIYTATVNDSSVSTNTNWNDLTLSPITNMLGYSFNPSGFDVSSIYVDPHDPTGNTIYVTLQGFKELNLNVAQVFRSLDGGAHWIGLTGDLPNAPANSILVDPNNANTVYVATDTGVYVTQNITLCTDTVNPCWSRLGTGLPYAPVTQLKYVNYSSTALLLASTYGRGIWQIPLLSAGTVATTASLTPSSLTFAAQQENTVSSAQTMTVTNTGTFTLTITSIATGADFSESDNCTQPLSPGATCAIQVSFAPQQTGTIQETLTVYGNLSGGQVAASLSGTGLNPGNVELLPGSLSFGNALVGTTTAAQNITISNTGGVSVNLQTPMVTGDFQISANTCGTSLAPNFGCTVAVVFAPKASGPRTGVFSIADSSGTQTVQLAGNGQMPATASVSPTNLNFSTPVIVGDKSSGQVVTLTNNGDVALSQIAISVTGDFTAENDCTALLAGHSSCAILVTFVPAQIGVATGALNVSTALGVQNVTLSGTGLAPPGVSVLPASVNFGPEGVNIPSSQQSIAITNNGGSTLTGLTVALASSGDFAIAANSCAATGTLAPATSCNIALTFTPTQTGLRSGSLTVGASNLSAPFTVPLSGTGEDFQLAVSGPTSAVIVNGQAATYQLQVVSVNGSSGALTMGCSGAPQNATCAINPSPLSFGIGGGTATVTVTTGVTSTSSSVDPVELRWQRMSAAFAVLLPCVFWGLRKRSNLLRCGLMCLASVALLASAACGTSASGGSSSSGGSGSSPTGPTTPSGVYTLNITASMGGLEKNVSVGLTVQ
ncbi:MAG TPA: choice-of-anchor D domain-containing protein [Pseudacidobacterium sp.]|jgi:hypothetical protein|nr:choice-of-anchor D domain-containing protein [Pseudacidobacterium sp.]